MQSQDESNVNTSNLKCCSTRLILRVSFEKNNIVDREKCKLEKRKEGRLLVSLTYKWIRCFMIVFDFIKKK